MSNPSMKNQLFNVNKSVTSSTRPKPCEKIWFSTLGRLVRRRNIETPIKLEFANHSMLTILTVNLKFAGADAAGQKNASSDALHETPRNITSVIERIIGVSNVTIAIELALNNHINLAGPFLTAIQLPTTNEDGADDLDAIAYRDDQISTTKAAFENQAIELAIAFTALDCSANYNHMLEHWNDHNECVVRIAEKLHKKNTSGFTAGAIVDSLEYFADNDRMAVAIADAVTKRLLRKRNL